MWLVLCDDADDSARWVHDGLRSRGVATELVTASALSHAVGWEHRVGPEGAWAVVALADGRRIDTRATTGTLNRLLGLWPPAAYAASPDGEYASQELLAMCLSVLRCLPPPVLNRPTAQGLSGRMRYTPDWCVLAARAGFAVAPLVVSTCEAAATGDGASTRAAPDGGAVSDDDGGHLAVVAAGRVFCRGLPAPVARAAARLADLAGLDLLGVHARTTERGAPEFAAADLYPDLRRAGDDLVDHLAALVREPVAS